MCTSTFKPRSGVFNPGFKISKPRFEVQISRQLMCIWLAIEIGTCLTCNSYYFDIYNSQYIEILCIYGQYLNTCILFFVLPDNLL